MSGGRSRIVALGMKIKSYPKKYTIPTAIFFAVFFFYALVFFMPKPVHFSYAHAPCVKQLTLFPDIHKSVDTTPPYEPRPDQIIKLGSWSAVSLSMCFVPTQVPQPGKTDVTISPFGGWFMSKTFVIATEPAPTVDMSILDAPVPASKSLEVPLSTTDRLFRYTFKVNEKEVVCTPKEDAIECPLEELQLQQGGAFTVQVIRQFGNENSEVITEQNLTTLPATRVVGTSIKPAEIVYAKPKNVDISFDKDITDIEYTLFHLEDNGAKRTPIPTDRVLNGKDIHITTAEDLPRSAKLELVIDSVQAVDESDLESPYVLPFEMSGGPKVASFNVNSTGIPLGTVATITFDQPLSQQQDIKTVVSALGGVVVSKRNDTQLSVSLASVPKCGDFTIKITNELKSSHEVTGNTAWEFTGRMICHSIATIGYSQRGRPINAYYFGSGPTAILYTGAIHGSELSTRDIMYQWVNDLEANARKIPPNKTIVVVPQINPDGVAAGTRTNARNVDLNRNFGTSDWRSDVTTVNNQPFPGGGGSSPMSEPETQAIGALVRQLHPALVLSYHSIGGLVMANQAGFSVDKARTYAQLSGYSNATGQPDSFEYGTSGTADDWYAQQLGVPSLLIELGSHTSHQFSRNRSAMWAMLQ